MLWEGGRLINSSFLHFLKIVFVSRHIQRRQEITWPTQTAKKRIILKVERSISPKSMRQCLLAKSFLHWRRSLYILGFLKFYGFSFSWGRIFFWISGYLWSHQQAPFLKRFVILFITPWTKAPRYTCWSIYGAWSEVQTLKPSNKPVLLYRMTSLMKTV